MESQKKDLYLVAKSLADALTDTKDKIIYKIIIETSCKVSELSRLKVNNISNNLINFGKRKVLISKELSLLISEYIKQENLLSDTFLFKTRQSNCITTRRIRQIIHQASQSNLGYKIDPKDLRECSIKQKLKIKDIESVRREAGLKRIDKRKYLSSKKVEKIKKELTSKRDYLIFKLLLNNFKSSEIVNFKVEDVLDSSIPESLSNELESFAISKGISFGEYLFNTRQKTHLTNERIFQIISNLGKKIEIEVSPRILNNTAIANALYSNDIKSKLNSLGVRTRATDIKRQFFINE